MGSGDSSAPIGVFIGIGVVYLALFVVIAWAYVNIVRRAGYSGWWVLIGLVPLVNLVMFLVFAFREWPVQRELAHLRALATGSGGPGFGGPGYGAPGPGGPGYGGPGYGPPGAPGPS